MRRRRTIRSAAAFGLFPFLAVLICTMGSLIVILVIMVRQAKVQAQAIADAPQSSAPSVSPEERARYLEADAKISDDLQAMSEAHARNIATLREQRDVLSHVEDHTRRLAERINELRQAIERLTDAQTSESVDQEKLAAALARTRQEIVAAEAELARARGRLAGRQQSYSLIPYDGPNGTPRRPIYIECMANRIVLQPEGIELRPSDFRPPIEASNPLSAALRATREYLAQRDPRLADQPPYPLLIVRPDGAEMYAEARAAMKSWGSEFGYELVRADMQLAYPAADPMLAQVQQRTVNIAREVVNRRTLIMSATANNDEETYLRANSYDGGFRVHRGSGSSSAGGAGSRGSADGNSADEGNFAGGGGGQASGGHSGGQPYPPGGANPTGSGQSNQYAAPGQRLDSAQAGPGGPDQSGSGQAATENVAAGNEVYNGQQSPGAGQYPQTAGGPQQQQNPLAPRTQAGSPNQASGEFRPGSMSAGPGGSAEGMAGSRGENWALPNYTPQATGFTRPIRIAVYQHQLVVLPEKGTGDPPRVIDVKGPLRADIDPFVSAVWKHVESWGIAGTRAYWKPELRVEVAPGAEARYQELVALLTGSGLTIQRTQP